MVNIEHCNDKTDEEIIALTLKNEEYFVCLVKRYQEKLLRYIRRISGVNIEEAEDILQDAFLKIYINLNDFDKALKFSSWAYRIIHNQVISNYRKNKLRLKSLSIEDFDNVLLEQLVSEQDLEEEFDLGYIKKNITKIINSLDLRDREILILRFFEQKSYKEISDIIKKPMGTVATLISRAKNKFKKEYIKLE